jgi:hypothetical protein
MLILSLSNPLTSTTTHSCTGGFFLGVSHHFQLVFYHLRDILAKAKFDRNENSSILNINKIG